VAPHFEFKDPYTGAPLVMDGAAPLAPPDEWFSQAAADDAPDKLMVFPGGRVAGVVAPAGRCLLRPGTDCWMVPKPRNQAELDMAHTGFTVTASGEPMRTAVLGGGAGHAKEWASADVAQRHYADTSTQLMRGVYRWSDKAGGMTFVGAVWPNVTPRQIAEINASPASVDYRWIADEQEHRLVGACLVNIGGLPTRWRAARTATAVIIIPERAPSFVAALGESEGSMIALRIDAPDFELPGGMPAEQMHLTLAYFGKASQYLPEVRSAAIAMVGAAVEAFAAPMLLEVSSVGVLGPVEESVVALLMQGEQLCGFRELAKSAGEAAGLVCDDSYPVFTPHITVGPYPGNLDAALALRGVAVSPPSVVVAFGSEDWTEFPLPRVGRPLEVETFVESESPDPDAAAASVTANEGAAMTCEHCGGTKTAASPVDGAVPPGPGGGDTAGAVTPEAFAELSARVDALETAMMGSEMAQLAAADVAIPA
jgi:hypothetical protein